ncbi:MAG: CoA transferase [Gemmatimonadales bacterium]|jgi:crotonobetainyl-CoA:carnitine CoA-transferase CaiB-like acyl-CoA transferase|nr:CoA transferase [Gemmatimonadales bacterium]MBT3772959.1 CoA transferase [Gemmatimonadales bacterium]MBT3957453.1 CoA transferase [Gemmatimonadales bacterium]MBT4438241.1 CoA transferase [Gemmatimonadales bacterium]MBT5046696.1 CoA transferase [Gemmatimonadales bacterium]
MLSALSGVRVVELSHIMAGPVCGLLLGDLGADVIKVERLPNGDGTRGFVPPDVKGESAAFMMLNRGKRGVAVDLRSEEGRSVVRRLVKDADVIIENFRAGTMEKMGLGYDDLSAINEKLVYCQITGFGSTGPMSNRGGFDLIAQGYSGLMSVTGEGPGRAPVKVGAPVTDITAGILAALGVVSALFERERTGKGQHVDTSLFEAGITQTFWQSAIALASGVSPGPMGSAHPLAAPYQTFPTTDGWINVGASNEATWTRLTEALNAAELREDPRFRTNPDRMAHLDDLVRVLAPHFLERSTESWLERLQDAGVPAGPIASVGEMLENPQTKARGMVIDVEHSSLGLVRSLGFPVKMSGSGPAEDAEPPRGAPLLGEHTRQVLAEAGFTGMEVDRLIGAEIVR